jgi:hypothetical protein
MFWLLAAVLCVAFAGFMALGWRSVDGLPSSRVIRSQAEVLGWRSHELKPNAAFVYWSCYAFAFIVTGIAVWGHEVEWDGGARQVLGAILLGLGTTSFSLGVVEWLVMRPRWLLPKWLRDGIGRASRRRAV